MNTESIISKKKWMTISLSLFLLLLLISAALPLFTVDAAKRTTTPSLNKTVCNSLDGTWKAGKLPTCTISSSVTLNSSFVIPAKVRLLVSTTGALSIATGNITNHGTISNGGNITAENTGTDSYGIFNDGTLTNNNGGTITFNNAGFNSKGVLNNGAFSNAGSMIFRNSGYEGLYNNKTAINSGTITIENSVERSSALDNYGTFSNSGTITIQNSGESSYGIYSEGNITSTGTLILSNNGSYSIGFDSYKGTFTNSGTITIGNTGGNSIGFENDYGVRFTNSATGTITIGGIGNYSEGIYNYGNFANAGTITINNATGDSAMGIANEAWANFTNSGTITNNQLDGYYGVYNYNGGHVINNGIFNNYGDVYVEGLFTNNGTFNNYGLISIVGSWDGSGTCTDIDSGSGCPV